MKNPIDVQLLSVVIEMLRLRFSKTEEAIPIYTDKEIDELFNCIERVYAGYWQTTEERIASLLINITKGHYLSNGNKRVAVIVASVLYTLEVQNSKPLNFEAIEKLVFGIAEGSINKGELLEEIYKLNINNYY